VAYLPAIRACDFGRIGGAAAMHKQRPSWHRIARLRLTGGRNSPYSRD